MMPEEVARLAQARFAALSEMLHLTEQADLSGGDDDAAERYVALVAERTGLMERLKAIAARLEEAGAPEPDSAAAAILAEGDETIKRILALDKQNEQRAQAAMDGLERHIKGLTAGRAASAAYHLGAAVGAGRLFDETH